MIFTKERPVKPRLRYLLPFIISIAWLHLLTPCHAQQFAEYNKEQALNELRIAKDVKTRLLLLNRLQLAYMRENREDSVLYYCNQCIELSRKQKLYNYEAGCLASMGAYNISRINYSKALSYLLKARQLSEQANDTSVTLQLLINIGGIYYDLDDPNSAVEYTREAAALAKAKKDTFLQATALIVVASYFHEINQPDSSLGYLQEAGLLISRQKKPDLWLSSFSQCEMGRYHRLTGNDEIARSYFLGSIEKIKDKINPESVTVKCFCYMGLSQIADKQGMKDTAIHYSRMALQSMQNWSNPKLLQLAYKQIASQFASVNKDSAIWYYQEEMALRDSLTNLKNLNEIKNMTQAEEERLQEREKLQKEAAEREKAVLEYAATGLVAILTIILFLLLSRTIIVNEKLIRFLGVMVLLIFFEFINLLMHPLLGSITHHSPALMLLCMVILAALLVPTHHKLEKWLLHRVVEKNRRIRLLAAKKTIRELEKPDQENQAT